MRQAASKTLSRKLWKHKTQRPPLTAQATPARWCHPTGSQPAVARPKAICSQVILPPTTATPSPPRRDKTLLKRTWTPTLLSPITERHSVEKAAHPPFEPLTHLWGSQQPRLMPHVPSVRAWLLGALLAWLAPRCSLLARQRLLKKR